MSVIHPGVAQIMVLLTNICFRGTQLSTWLMEVAVFRKIVKLARSRNLQGAIIRCMQQHPVIVKPVGLQSKIGPAPWWDWGVEDWRGIYIYYTFGWLSSVPCVFLPHHSCEDKGKVQCHNRGNRDSSCWNGKHTRSNSSHCHISVQIVLRPRFGPIAAADSIVII